MKSTPLPYGDGAITLEATGIGRTSVLIADAPASSPSAASIIADALAAPIGAPPLRELARGRESAAILIPGKARRVGTRDYVPALVDELNAAGIPDDRIEIFLADGTHVQHLEQDVIDLLGERMVRRVRCVGHDARDKTCLREVGTTSRGTPVQYNRRVLEAGVRVLTGRIVPHYFAGYSGGRKAILPGVAGFDSIVANHRLTLAPDRGIHPGARPCSLEDNPVHLDMVEASRLGKPDFCFNTIMDVNDRLIGAVAGDNERAHVAGCELAGRYCRVSVPEPFDAMITSAGGMPYDMNFMQSIKALFNHQAIVKPGGAILWLAEAKGGVTPGFFRWLAMTDDDELDATVRAGYNLTGHNSIMLRRSMRRNRVALLSVQPADDVRRLGFEPVSTLDEGLAWLAKHGPKTCAVVPHANVMASFVAGEQRGEKRGSG